MNRTTALVAFAALLAGFASGWAVKPESGKDATDEIRERGPRKKRRVADSETRVKTVTTVITNTVHSTATNTVTAAAERPRGPGGFMADLERMKEEDPKRYASMTNRMAQFRNRMFRRAENKLETLAAVDTTGWSRSQIENHEKYQNLIVRHQELMELMRPDSGASQPEREAAFREMRELGRELHATSEKVRNNLLDKTFQELGYSGSDCRELRETIKTIYSTTEEWGGHRGRGHRPGR